MIDWQPIETAPKNTTILLYSHNARIYKVCYWCDNNRWVDWTSYWPEPTHWAELRPPIQDDPPETKDVTQIDLDKIYARLAQLEDTTRARLSILENRFKRIEKEIQDGR